MRWLTWRRSSPGPVELVCAFAREQHIDDPPLITLNPITAVLTHLHAVRPRYLYAAAQMHIITALVFAILVGSGVCQAATEPGSTSAHPKERSSSDAELVLTIEAVADRVVELPGARAEDLDFSLYSGCAPDMQIVPATSQYTCASHAFPYPSACFPYPSARELPWAIWYTHSDHRPFADARFVGAVQLHHCG